MEIQNYAKCATCGTTEKLLRCAKCKTIFYCSTAHQHMDWPRHKAECRNLSKQLQQRQQQQHHVIATSVVTPAIVPALNGFINNSEQQQQQHNNELQENNMLMQQMHIGSNAKNLASGFGVDSDYLNVNNGDINSISMMNFNKLPDANTSSILQIQQDDVIVQQQQQHHQIQQEQEQAAEYVPQFSTQANNQLEKSSSYQIGQVDMLLGNVKYVHKNYLH